MTGWRSHQDIDTPCAATMISRRVSLIGSRSTRREGPVKTVSMPFVVVPPGLESAQPRKKF
jgi:hypothetical protein